MKKFAKMLALGLALSMTFGMAVSAAELNPSVVTKEPENVKIELPAGVEQIPATEEEKELAVNSANIVAANPGSIFGADYKNVEILGTYFLEGPKDGKAVTVTFELPELGANKSYSLLHVKEDGAIETINLVLKDGKYTAEISSFSPFILVVKEYSKTPAYNPPAPSAPTTNNNGAPVSPKTGETLPVAGMMAVLCLAGAVVCAKKARCNN